MVRDRVRIKVESRVRFIVRVGAVVRDTAGVRVRLKTRVKVKDTFLKRNEGKGQRLRVRVKG